jgi:hypothetical protein
MRSSRTVERKASARTSAACLFAFPLLTGPFPDVTSPKCVSTLTMVVYCHLPPRAVGIPLRFNSPASDRRDTKPAALSSRMVGTKTRARDSAARLFANAPCNPRLRRDVSPCSIGPSWLVLDVRLGGKNVATSDLLGQHYCKASVALNHIRDCNLGPSIHRKPALRSTREPATSVAGPALPGRPFFISSLDQLQPRHCAGLFLAFPLRRSIG